MRIVSKFRARLSAAFIILATLVFIDELIKEGYGFNLYDLYSPTITHEKLFIIFLILAIFFGWRRKNMKKRNL